eukprot:CAMPEP_0178379290 /NCGR_PEP_ID=MMETSP0689_2-20121128/4866_1 /TAXON_ID=160604 /ORGANISM="Amphidinium massartii, Strain CS-259" /LENGTH=284 /DNA_ID=CAMNT_0019999387 /DNA_START=16 /DNA_END=870 /DNA_ORIENTATION=+
MAHAMSDLLRYRVDASAALGNGSPCFGIGSHLGVTDSGTYPKSGQLFSQPSLSETLEVWQHTLPEQYGADLQQLDGEQKHIACNAHYPGGLEFAQALQSACLGKQHPVHPSSSKAISPPTGTDIGIPTSQEEQKHAEAERLDASTQQGVLPLSPQEVLTHGCTSLMVRNLPHEMKQRDVLLHLEAWGFGDTFDFVYVPHSFRTRFNLGYAFINFLTPELAANFVREWSGTKRFKDQQEETVLMEAAVQGLDNLISMCVVRKLLKVRNPAFKPYIRDVTLVPEAL